MKKTLNPIALLICLILMVIFSCEKDNLLKNTCGVKNPTKDQQVIWRSANCVCIN